MRGRVFCSHRPAAGADKTADTAADSDTSRANRSHTRPSDLRAARSAAGGQLRAGHASFNDYRRRQYGRAKNAHLSSWTGTNGRGRRFKAAAPRPIGPGALIGARPAGRPCSCSAEQANAARARNANESGGARRRPPLPAGRPAKIIITIIITRTRRRPLARGDRYSRVDCAKTSEMDAADNCARAHCCAL